MDAILERDQNGGALFLGNIEAAQDVNNLKRNRIGAVLTIASRTGLNYNPRDIPHHEII